MSQRSSFRAFGFSADGRHAALLESFTERAWLEGWTLSPHGPRRTFQHPWSNEIPNTYALPLYADRFLMVSTPGDGMHLHLLGPDGVLATEPAPALSTVATAPAGYGPVIGLAATHGGTAIYQLADDLIGAGPGCEPVTHSASPLHGQGLVVGDRVLFHTRVEGCTTPVFFDPQTARLTPLELPQGSGNAVPVSAAGDQVLLGLSSEGKGRLGVVSLTRPGQLDPVHGLDALTGNVRPLALSPDGAELLLRVRHGVRSRLLVHHRFSGRTREIDFPLGTPEQATAWTEDGLWLMFSPTSTPTGLWWLPPDGQSLLPIPPKRASGKPAQVESLPGAVGQIEAIGYGDWRTAERVVIALHGGPAEHWQLRFDPKLQAMAAEAAIVAPNQRGSTGYGRAYELAIKGAWGGPDLADILTIGAHVTQVRGQSARLPVLYGVSYGAFLALLAMAFEPHRWSGCVAVAPFLNSVELRAEAKPPVRALIDRLDGTAPVLDYRGPRDLAQVANRIRGRVLLVHGAQDATVPVTHSRRLAATLSTVPGVQLTYREIPDRGHDPVLPDSPELAEIVQFLCEDALPDQREPTTKDHLPGHSHPFENEMGGSDRRKIQTNRR